MSLFADIASLDEEIQRILDDALADIDTHAPGFSDAVVSAILSLLDDQDLGDLARTDVATLVEDALAETFTGMDDELRRITATRVQELIDATNAFYEALGIDPSGVVDAVRRSQETAAIRDLFDEAMRLRREQLQDEATDALLDAVGRGDLNRTRLAEEIAERADVSLSLARTQTDTSISAYNQTYRNTLATNAGLEHRLYYGNLKATSRPFCVERAGKVYTLEQIAEMDNGMLNPVKVFKGGWRCWHQWLPVDLGWDDSLPGRVVEPEETE